MQPSQSNGALFRRANLRERQLLLGSMRLSVLRKWVGLRRRQRGQQDVRSVLHQQLSVSVRESVLRSPQQRQCSMYSEWGCDGAAMPLHRTN